MDFDLDLRGFLKSKIDATSHNVESSLSELIHNSLDADAKDIFILHNDYKNPLIIDNGCGMNKDNIDTLKKFYDSRQRTKNTIGAFNIGLKDCLLNLSGKWYILSKKSETDELVYCTFDSIKLKKYAYGGNYDNCIDSGYASPKLTKLYKTILDNLGLINKNNDMSYERFSGTIVYQYENDNDLDEDEGENYETSYKNLYNDLKVKLVNCNSNFKYGNYRSIDTLDKCKLTSIENIDWLCWDETLNNLEFEIEPYKINKTTSVKINYDGKNYKYYSSKGEFGVLQAKPNVLGIINVKCNIISERDLVLQEEYYKELGYKSSINGIMIYRNDLSLYDYPNKWNGIYLKDTKTERRYIRVKVSFKNNEDLDKLFNILPNKSLFLKNKMNKKLVSLFDFIIGEVYEYMDLKLYNNISLKEVFKDILTNKSLSVVKSQFEELEKKWNTMMKIKYNSMKIAFRELNQKSKLCKIISFWDYSYLLNLLYKNLRKMRTNYSIDKKKDCINHIFDLLYNYDLKLKINQLKYNYKISNSFKDICNKGLNMIKYKQLCLFKYRYKCKELEDYLDIY